jgi:COP9 signalosome complex subunit 6
LSWRLETHEAERIAVDHVSRAPNTALAKPSKAEDDAQSSQAQDISYLPSEESDLTFLTSQSNAIRVLQSRLQLIRNYVADVRQGKIEGDASLLSRLQAVLARLPQKDDSEEKQDAALQAEQQDSATEVALVTLLSDMMALSTNMSALVGDMNEAHKARGPGNAAAQGLPSAFSRNTFDTEASRHDADFSAMVYD